MPLYDNNPKEVAAALKQNALNMYKKIQPSEFENMNWEKKPELSPNMLAVMQASNKITSNILNEILMQENQKDQQKVYNFYVKLMEASVKGGDYQTALSIYTGLNQGAIDRLNYLKGDKNINKILESSSKEVSIAQNFKVLRDNMDNFSKKKSIPMVPAIQPTTSKLVLTSEPLSKMIGDLKTYNETIKTFDENISKAADGSAKAEIQKKKADYLEEEGTPQDFQNIIDKMKEAQKNDIKTFTERNANKNEPKPLKPNPKINVTEWLNQKAVLQNHSDNTSSPGKDEPHERSLAIYSDMQKNSKAKPFSDAIAITVNASERDMREKQRAIDLAAITPVPDKVTPTQIPTPQVDVLERGRERMASLIKNSPNPTQEYRKRTPTQAGGGPANSNVQSQPTVVAAEPKPTMSLESMQQKLSNLLSNPQPKPTAVSNTPVAPKASHGVFMFSKGAGQVDSSAEARKERQLAYIQRHKDAVVAARQTTPELQQQNVTNMNVSNNNNIKEVEQQQKSTDTRRMRK